MSRWPIRMLGILLLIVFVLMFAHLYKQLAVMQQMRKAPAAQAP